MQLQDYSSGTSRPNPAEIAEEERLLCSLGLVPGSRPPWTNFPGLDPRFSIRCPSAWFWRGMPTELIAADLLADLPHLRFMMRQAYIGWEIAEGRGWDWELFFSNWVECLTLKASRRVSWDEAFEPWQDLMTYQLDNHSGPKSASSQIKLSHTVLLPTYKSGDLDTTHASAKPWKAFLADFSGGDLRRAWAVSYPVGGELGREEVELVPAGERRGRRQASLDLFGGESEDELLYRDLSPAIAYLRIPTLIPRVGAAAEALHAVLPRDAFHRRWVVVDLRGNGGGMAPAVFNILDQIPGWRQLEWQQSFSIRTKTSSVGDELQWGAVQAQLEDAPTPLPNTTRERFQMVLDKVQQADRKSTEPVMRDFRSTTSFQDHRFPWQPKPGHPQIAILTDSDCGSDGEFLAYALSLIPGSVILGTCTGGVAQFARPGLFLLPYTGVPFRLASSFVDIYGDGSAFEGRGLRPDILLAQAEPLSPKMLANLLARLPELS